MYFGQQHQNDQKLIIANLTHITYYGGLLEQDLSLFETPLKLQTP